MELTMAISSPPAFEFFVEPFLFRFAPSPTTTQLDLSVTLFLAEAGLQCCSFFLSPPSSQFNLSDCKSKISSPEWPCGYSMSGPIWVVFGADGKNNVIYGNDIIFKKDGYQTPPFSGIMGSWSW
ncbi:hypothetical protein [Mucilaginibacter sp.]|uniref:hypothetical protein n=1 Tax=Mucilaginibacter sp. TaxID=1882438 RepID=UPI00260A2778|nr:hypothetical protein [Mucilaginibacter sp.]MDB4921798.1 hypothetical protein [Mucilaginibacter sp.]